MRNENRIVHPNSRRDRVHIPDQMNPNETGPVLIRESRGMSSECSPRRTRKNRIGKLFPSPKILRILRGGGISRDGDIFCFKDRYPIENGIRSLGWGSGQQVGRSAEISDLTENLLTEICVGSQQVTKIFPARIFEPPPLRNLKGEHLIRGFAAHVPRGGGDRCELSAGNKALPELIHPPPR
ncbi:hypothetical protein CEXT_732851 [Caerostris extrusa]|uniref:Ribosomal protein S3 n=1 Tax=Caerostris extrusa TaxID=172846 RepID=A0AAV4R0R7_CAEEX|nr:hypothetical protein CEXT_732851 [Caerostris extrusa]